MVCASTVNSGVKEEDRVMGKRAGVARFGAIPIGRAPG